MELYKLIIAFLIVFITGIPVCSIAQTMNRPTHAKPDETKQDNPDGGELKKERPRPTVTPSPPTQLHQKPAPLPPPAKTSPNHKAPRIKYTTVRRTTDIPTPQPYWWYCYHSRYPFPHSKCELRSASYSYYDVYRAKQNQSFYIPPIIRQDGRNPDKRPR